MKKEPRATQENVQYVYCPYSKRLLFAGQFPRQCSNCGRNFENRSDYYFQTTPAGNGKLICREQQYLLEMRNCSCGSTISLKFIDERDYTEVGKFRLEKTQELIEHFKKDGSFEQDAKRRAMEEFNRLFPVFAFTKTADKTDLS